MTRIKVDLHTHTNASFDSWLTPERYARRAVALGFGAMAITDHGTIDGALRVRDLDPPFQVIVAQEIFSTAGEIIGLFLELPIPGGLSPRAVCEEIRAQGGLVHIPHPFGCFALERLKPDALTSLLDLIDSVEVLNARNTFPSDDRDAEAFADRHGFVKAAGSDSHLRRDMGRAYQYVRPFDGPRDFLDALREGERVLERRTFLGLSLGPQLYGLGRLARGKLRKSST